MLNTGICVELHSLSCSCCDCWLQAKSSWFVPSAAAQRSLPLLLACMPYGALARASHCTVAVVTPSYARMVVRAAGVWHMLLTVTSHRIIQKAGAVLGVRTACSATLFRHDGALLDGREQGHCNYNCKVFQEARQ